MKHSELGASSAYRWMNCPGSVALIRQVPEQPDSPYAAEGTKAHELAEKILTNQAICPDDYSKEMRDYVKIYTDYVPEGSDIEVRVEVDRDLGMFGTCDAISMDHYNLELEIIDLKYGEGVQVSPENNTQLMYYALGAIKRIHKKHKVFPESIKLTIVQPRGEGKAIKSWETKLTTLLDWRREKLIPAAEATRESNAPLKYGDWCRWCAAKAICPKMQEETYKVCDVVFNDETKKIELPSPKDLSPEKMKEVLDFSKVAASWFKDVAAHAHQSVERGAKIPGYKLVKKRSNRKWVDEEKAIELISAYGHKDRAYEKTILSPAKAEKLEGICKESVLALCVKSEAGTTLVPEKDKREEIAPAISVFDTINNN